MLLLQYFSLFLQGMEAAALCPLFRDVNCIECEVYYVKLLTVIYEVYKRLTKICGSYILYLYMEMAHR